MTETRLARIRLLEKELAELKVIEEEAAVTDQIKAGCVVQFDEGKLRLVVQEATPTALSEWKERSYYSIWLINLDTWNVVKRFHTLSEVCEDYDFVADSLEEYFTQKNE